MSPNDERERIVDHEVDDGRDRIHEDDLHDDDSTLDPERDRINDPRADEPTLDPDPDRDRTRDRDLQDDEGIIGPEGYSESTRLPSLSRLRGMAVRTTDGEKIGKVKDVYLDAEARHARYLLVKTGWFSGSHVVPVDDVTYVDDGDDAYVEVPYAEEQLKGAPTFGDDDEVTPDREREIYDHSQRVGYWDQTRDIVRARQTEPAPTPQIAEAEVADAIRRGRDPERVRVKRWGA